MIMIIDAYNVIHALSVFEEKLGESLNSARDALISFCRTFKAAKPGIEKIILVFDGSSEVLGAMVPGRGGVEAVFTPTGEEADDRIARILRSLPVRTAVTVVSNDNSVRNSARATGARMMSAAEFFGGASLGKRSAGMKPGLRPCEKISRAEAGRITAEYKRYLGLD